MWQKRCLFPWPRESLQSVIMDIWARSIYNQQGEGETTKPEQAHNFQVTVQMPHVAVDFVPRVGAHGVYIQPRSSANKGPHHDDSIIWLAGQDRKEALHKVRTCTHRFALARLHHRYGIRVTKQFQKQPHEQQQPEDEYLDIAARQVYNNFPVAYWLQKLEVVKLLAAWKWAAKPLQPTKGNQQGQDWTVGRKPRRQTKCFQVLARTSLSPVKSR